MDTITSPDSFVQLMTERMTTLARHLAAWVQAEPRSLQEQEQLVLGQLHELGNLLLGGLLSLAAAAAPATLPCPCGATASFCRLRPATVTTLLGRLTYTRATYHCQTCHHGHAPLDRQLHVAAGSFSLGLQEVLALLGATQDSFAEAASVLARLCLVQVCPNSVRAATEEVGATLLSHTEEVVCNAQKPDGLPAPQTPVPPRLYVSMDGVLIHCRTSGWREVKLGCVYTTRLQRARRAPYQQVLCLEQPSYSASLAEATGFRWQLAVEAARRGTDAAAEVVVIGDGAHWIWTLAEQHFPHATQIVDWYHASQYLWQAASALHGEGGAARDAWAKQHLDALWEGRLEEVLAALEPSAGDAGAVDAALSYYQTHRERMDYPSYRARGLQVGSGTIESGCKQVVSARLKQAGMQWSEAGAEAVVSVRAWLKSGRWKEAMELRKIPQRSYQRRNEPQQPEAEQQEPQQRTKEEQAARAGGKLSEELLARVQAELVQEQACYSWRKPWSRRQQQRQAEQRQASTTHAPAA